MVRGQWRDINETVVSHLRRGYVSVTAHYMWANDIAVCLCASVREFSSMYCTQIRYARALLLINYFPTLHIYPKPSCSNDWVEILSDKHALVWPEKDILREDCTGKIQKDLCLGHLKWLECNFRAIFLFFLHKSRPCLCSSLQYKCEIRLV